MYSHIISNFKFDQDGNATAYLYFQDKRRKVTIRKAEMGGRMSILKYENKQLTLYATTLQAKAENNLKMSITKFRNSLHERGERGLKVGDLVFWNLGKWEELELKQYLPSIDK